MFDKEQKSGEAERQFDEHWRSAPREHPEGSIRISSRECFSTIFHSCMSFVAPIALGVSFLLYTLLAKQHGNYANNERLIKSRFRRGDVAVKKERFMKIHLRRNTEICQQNKILQNIEYAKQQNKDTCNYLYEMT